MKEQGIQYLDKPNRKLYPYCDYNPRERGEAQTVFESIQSRFHAPDVTHLSAYKKLLYHAGVPPIDIMRCIRKLNGQTDEQTTSGTLQPVEVFSENGE